MLASAAPLAADRDAAAATALLRQVFRFRHKPPSIVQEEAECVQLARCFAAFADAAEVAHDERVAFSATDPLADDRRVPLHVFAPEELHALQQACAVLNVDRSAHGPRARGAVWIETWLSKYGCALQLEAVSVASVALKLVVLDGWEHVKHFLADGTCVHSAVPRAVSVLNCGSVRPDQQPKLLRELRLEIDRAQPRTGAQRSAGFNDIGHQKTPQFIAALVRIARARVAGASRTDSRPVIHGGTTDVGLHTGGQGRDTCWPLVQAVVQQNLPGSGALFDKAMMRFKLSLAQAKAELVSRHASDDSVSSASGMSAFWDAAEDAFIMLQTVVLDVVALVRRGYDATGVERVCDAVRQRIVDATASVNAAVAARYTLPTSAAFDALKRAASLPRIARLRYSDVYSSVQEGYDSRQHASQNVGLHAFVNPDTCDASTLIKWLDVMRSVVGNAQTPLVVLRTIESFVFTQSSWLHAVAAESTLTPDATSLRAILHEYDKRLAEWTKDPLASSLLEVEQRSRSLLVKWTAFCVAHKALVSECALLKNYGIALSWEVLEVAVLRDKAAIDTLSRVTKYIRSWNQRGYKPIFDLNDPAPTVHFVRAFASESEIYTQRYTEELKRFGQRVTFHWKSIVKKKQAAVALQAEIAQIDVTLRHYDQVLREEQARLAAANRHLPHHLQRWDSPAVSEYATHINNLSTWRFTKERVLEDTRSMPGFLVNPLPRERMHALEVLFFLDIPKDVAGLWQLCLEAQRALAPPTLSTEALESMRDDGAKTTWLEHYRAYGSKSYASTAPLVGYVTGLTIPQSYGPWSIDEVQGQEECAGRCIWYPSGDSDTRVYWTDPSGAIVNPFRIPRTLMVRYFTHEFAAAYRDLQWAVAYPGGEQRGNVVYAKLSEPLLETFDRHAFIHFGMLRAFPNQQIRRVCHALKDNVLPWSHPCVVAVVRQAMYQVGTLTDEEFPSFAWKADIADPNGAAMLSASIDQVATQLDLTPRNFEDVPLLSELAAFASQTADDSRQTVAKFATMCRRWAGDVRKQYHSNRSISSAELVELRAKECLLYGYALQSYAFGSLRRDDLVAVGELVVLFRNSLLFAKGSNLLPKLQRLELVVSEILAKRVGELVEVFKSGARLTRLVRLVSESAPAHIQWTNATTGAQWTSSFNGVDKATGTFYAVNLFNGLVLIDGSACGGLPSEIRASERYRALFGDHDFEVAFSRGVYRTTHPIDGRYFDFSLLGNELRVRQVYYDATRTCVEKVLDLCPADWLAALDTALPACVVEMHSLWVWVEEKCVLVCPLDTLRQAVEYVATFAADRDGVDSVRCVQVPASDKRLPTHEILKRASEYPAFVTVDADLLRILGKFEAAAFTHVLREPSGVLTISFPRCRLTFVLNERHELASAEYDGYVLDECQQYEDAFPLFARYLVLRLKDAATSSTTKPTTRILVPFGRVVRDASSGMIDVQVPNEPSAKLVLSVFESHLRLRTLSTESIPSRLQLCALLAAAGSNIPSKCFAMTGSEAALQVLHGCFFSAPLAAADKDALTNVCAFGHREPGLKILASSILLQSERCSFLAAADRVDADGVGGSIDCAYELDEYSARCAQCPERNPLRSRLRKAEERLLLSHIPESDTLAKVSVDALVELAPAPVKATYVSETEALFARFLRAADVAAAPPPLPLSQLTSDAMGEAMSAELLDSWNAYHTHYDKQLATSPKALALMCALVLKDVRRKREQTERYLLAAVDATRSSASSRLLHLINYLPTPTVTDLVRSSFDDEVLLHLAARLSLDARAVFRAATLQFMELCVLEDKLERLVRAGEQARSSSSSDAGLLDELGSVRQWVSAEHPYWLAFEVEGRLQIRHEQYVVAAHLIATPGAVSQMNMGRGKTKVILPMLFLYFSHRHRGDRIVRAHFLTPLLSETRQFMHRTLSASSILQLHFVEHPFHRNIELDAARLSLLQEDLADARASGRFLLIAPEHRMSLELKLLDLRSSAHDEEHQRDMVRVLEAILDHRQYVDVLDESDAVLHHKYHLIYAVGAPQKLESGECRWLAAEALLHALAGAERNPESELRRLLLEPHVGFRSPEYADRLGGYDGLRLNASVSDKPRVRQRLREALVCEVFADPPLSLKWLRAFSLQSAPTSRQLVRALTDPSVSLDAALDGCDPGVMRFRSELLALRGLLAFGVLEHCLEKRHRVEFGLPEAATRRKRMAIPFRAADIPSERSEFSHPEVGLTLTLLAYYNTGLSEAELRETLHQLLQLGASEQDQFYALWLAAVQRGLPADIVDEFPRSPRQLSPNDTRQFAVLYRVFRYTMAVVNFFANTCVFPSDTTQYPLRLTRSAWNVAGGDWNVGFSGTNDNHRLLPLSVRQCEPAAPALLGTNGRMIDRILRVCQGFAQVEADAGGGAGTPWQRLLQLALAKRAHALIDTGALLAGVLNNDAALYLLDEPGFPFAGVTYYDTRKRYDCWVVLDAASRLVTPLKDSTVLEEDTFVVFDDARSRGSDLKLDAKAVAVLTLGPKLTKDKLMQGAGRMRQLGCDQTLWFVSLSEVAQDVLQLCGKDRAAGVRAVDILDWVMANTKTEAVLGLLEWANSGLHFSQCQQCPDAELRTEDWSVEALYAPGHRARLIRDIVDSRARALLGDDTLGRDDLVRTICARGATFGLDAEVLVTSHDDECERELHNEQFEEREDAAERVGVVAVGESPWDFQQVLNVGSVRELAGSVEVVALGAFVRRRVRSASLSAIGWDAANVFGTANFFSTVATPSTGNAVSDFPRLADALLAFADGSNLLVSEFEADAMLPLLRTRAGAAARCTLVSLSSAVDAIDAVHGPATLARDVPWSVGGGAASRQLDASLTTLCQLFNGDTMFSKRTNGAVDAALRAHLRPLRKRERAFQEFAVVRGCELRWRYSFLHTLCHEMDLEDFVAPETVVQSPPSQQPRTTTPATATTTTATTTPKGRKAARAAKQAARKPKQ